MSLGKDLATIRKEKNLTLEDLYSATKIPIYTLQSIEDDTLFTQSSESKTYLRSFIRSYAKALKIADAHIIKALEIYEKEEYDGDLLKLIKPEPKVETFSVKKETVEVEENGDPAKEEKKEPNETPPSVNVASSAQPAQKEHVTPDATKARSPKDAPTVDSIDWANMSKKVYSSPTGSRLGIIALVILVVGALGAAGYYFSDSLLNVFQADTNQPEEVATNAPTEEVQDNNTPNQSAAIENDQPALNPETTTTEASTGILGDTLTIAVYAAFDKLEPVRVTSDYNWRTNPFWMDRGEAYYFDFKDTVLVRGQYSRMVLLFNGHIINNPRQNNFSREFDSILLTRADLSKPEYQAPPVDFPLTVGEPDSIVYRIRY